MDEKEKTKGGQPVYRYEAVERDWSAPELDEAIRTGFEKHLDHFFGEGEVAVWHELVSDLVHIDVYMAKPTEQRPFCTLITSGMSDLPMTLPDAIDESERADYERAELVMCLPPDWPLTQEAFEKPENYWPIGLLKMLARLPHDHKTWLGWGHSIPNGHPAEPFAGTQFTGVVLGPPVDLPQDFWSFQVEVQGKQQPVSLYGVFPVYTEEMEYKINSERGADALFEKFSPFEVSLMVQVNRPNVITTPPPKPSNLNEA